MYSLQHVAVVAHDVDSLRDFYSSIVGLDDMPAPPAQDEGMMKFRWMQLGEHELHIVEKDSSYARRNDLLIDPSQVPHFAIRLQPGQMDEVKRRFDQHAVPWMDWSTRGISGWNQLFVKDPEGNLIELEGW